MWRGSLCPTAKVLGELNVIFAFLVDLYVAHEYSRFDHFLLQNADLIKDSARLIRPRAVLTEFKISLDFICKYMDAGLDVKLEEN